MYLEIIVKTLGSQIFSNLLLLITVLVAFIVGYRQIYINDVVELYATASIKQVVNVDNGSKTDSMIISIQNVGTRLVYLDKYIFNGSEYITNGQILPPTYSQSNAGYWIDLPSNGTHHVSIVVYYHDLDKRKWKSEIVADFSNNIWKASTLPRIEQ